MLSPLRDGGESLVRLLDGHGNAASVNRSVSPSIVMTSPSRNVPAIALVNRIHAGPVDGFS